MGYRVYDCELCRSLLPATFTLSLALHNCVGLLTHSPAIILSSLYTFSIYSGEGSLGPVLEYSLLLFSRHPTLLMPRQVFKYVLSQNTLATWRRICSYLTKMRRQTCNAKARIEEVKERGLQKRLHFSLPVASGTVHPVELKRTVDGSRVLLVAPKKLKVVKTVRKRQTVTVSSKWCGRM